MLRSMQVIIKMTTIMMMMNNWVMIVTLMMVTMAISLKMMIQNR